MSMFIDKSPENERLWIRVDVSSKMEIVLRGDHLFGVSAASDFELMSFDQI